VDDGGHYASVGQRGARLRADRRTGAARRRAGQAQVDDDGAADVWRQVAQEQRGAPLSRDRDAQPAIAKHIAGGDASRNGLAVELERLPDILELAILLQEEPVVVMTGKLVLLGEPRPET